MGVGKASFKILIIHKLSLNHTPFCGVVGITTDVREMYRTVRNWRKEFYAIFMMNESKYVDMCLVSVIDG